MAVNGRTSTHEIASASLPGWRRLFAGGPAGNERLTGVTGAMLLVLLAVEGVTILFLGRLLGLHMFLGLLLIPPVALKLASTGYRFVRYYTASPAYRRKGPPPALLRIIAPIVVVSTLAVFASGVALLLGGPQTRHALLPIHKISFIVWVALAGVHVLGHLPGMASVLRADHAASRGRAGRVDGQAGRELAIAGAIAAGAILAVLLVPDFAVWLGSSRGGH
jgi:hypothetical protein